MGGPVIALLGADGSGKTTLAAALAAALTERGLRALALPAPADEAADDGSIVLADTPPRLAEALLRRRRCRAVLLMGLDLAARPDSERVDASLRATLDAAGLGYAVVYGRGEARVTAALAALAAPLGLAPRRTDDAGRPLRLRCRDCLVPGCEHLLFPTPNPMP
jgi:energy-coupling factor transporter ATP-binding protein EcfA2